MPETATEAFSWNVFELRQYSLLPGRRDDLIALFDRHFVESQEEGGLRVLGQFRDLDNPDRFVWLRAFADMTARTEALSAFYEHHAAWREHREAANDTMADSDNVLLLRPVAGSGRPDAKADEVTLAGRPPVSAGAGAEGEARGRRGRGRAGHGRAAALARHDRDPLSARRGTAGGVHRVLRRAGAADAGGVRCTATGLLADRAGGEHLPDPAGTHRGARPRPGDALRQYR